MRLVCPVLSAPFQCPLPGNVSVGVARGCMKSESDRRTSSLSAPCWPYSAAFWSCGCEGGPPLSRVCLCVRGGEDWRRGCAGPLPRRRSRLPGQWDAGYFPDALSARAQRLALAPRRCPHALTTMPPSCRGPCCISIIVYYVSIYIY